MKTRLTAARVACVRHITARRIVLARCREARVVAGAGRTEVAVVAGARVRRGADARTEPPVEARFDAAGRLRLAAFTDEAVDADAHVLGGGHVAARGTVQASGVGGARVAVLTGVAVVTVATDAPRTGGRYLRSATVTTVNLLLMMLIVGAAALGGAIGVRVLTVAR